MNLAHKFTRSLSAFQASFLLLVRASLPCSYPPHPPPTHKSKASSKMSPVAHIPFETTQTVDRRNNHTTTTADVLFNNKPSSLSSSSAVRILPSYRDDQVSLVFPKPIFAGHLPQHSLVAAFAPLWDQYELLEEAFPSSQEVSHGDQRLQQLNDMACNGQTPVAAGAATLVENQRGGKSRTSNWRVKPTRSRAPQFSWNA